jgi:hypothetical protein
MFSYAMSLKKRGPIPHHVRRGFTLPASVLTKCFHKVKERKQKYLELSQIFALALYFLSCEQGSKLMEPMKRLPPTPSKKPAN